MNERMTERLYIRMPPSLFKALHRLAANRYMSASDVAREAIAKLVENHQFEREAQKDGIREPC